MQAITLDAHGAAPTLRDDLPEPTPAEHEVILRVHASSANPGDNMIAAGLLAKEGLEYEFPVTLGRDFAGVVERAGAAVRDLEPGDRVFGVVLPAAPTVRAGAWAELIAVPAGQAIARVPDRVDLAVAGAAPVAGLAAIAAVEALEITPGEDVLVGGATGGVGSLAVQLAARAGANVIAPALPQDEGFLRDLGVSVVLPREGDLVAAVRERFPDGVDALLDLVSYVPGAYDAALRDGARVASATCAAGEGPGRTNVMGDPTPESLERLGALLADGTLRVPVQASYPLARAPEALAALETGHKQGKLAIAFA